MVRKSEARATDADEVEVGRLMLEQTSIERPLILARRLERVQLGVNIALHGVQVSRRAEECEERGEEGGGGG